MYLFHCKFIIFLIVWCYANTVNCTPVALESKIKLNFGDGSSMLTDDFQSEGNAPTSDKIVAVTDDIEKLDTEDKKEYKDESELILQTDSFDTVVQDSTSTQESTDIGNSPVVPPPDELPKNEVSPQDKPSTSNEASTDDQNVTNVEGPDDTRDSTSVEDSKTSQNMDLTDTISTPDMPEIVVTGTELEDPIKLEDALTTQLESFSNPETSGQPSELDTNTPGESELDVTVPEISEEPTATGLDIVSKTNTLELEKDPEPVSPDVDNSKLLQVSEAPLKTSADTVGLPNTSELDVSAIDDLDRDTTSSDTTSSDRTSSDTTSSDTTSSDTTSSDTTSSDTTSSDTTSSDTTSLDTTSSDTTSSDTTSSDTTSSDTTSSDTTSSDTTSSDTTSSDAISSDTTSSDTLSLDTSSSPNISEEPTATILDTSTPNMSELDETVTVVKFGDLDGSNNPEISDSTVTEAVTVPITSSNMNGDTSITSLDTPITTNILEEPTTTALDETDMANPTEVNVPADITNTDFSSDTSTTTTDTLSTPEILEEPTADIVSTPNTSELEVPLETTPNMSGDVVGDKPIIFDSPNSPDEQTTSETDVEVMPETLETPETPIIEDKVNTPEVSSDSDQDTSKITDTVSTTSPQTVGTDQSVISDKRQSNSVANENVNAKNPITSTDNRYDFDMDDLDEFLKYDDLEDPENSEITSVENKIMDELEKSIIESMKASRPDLFTKYERTKANYKHPDEVIDCNCGKCTASNDFDFIDAFEPDREIFDFINSNIGRFNNDKYNSFGQKSYDIVDVDGDFLEQ